MKRLTERKLGDLVVEVVLIVLGITCALWFDGVKESRDQRRLERSILIEMTGTLESDTADFRQAVDGLNSIAAAVDTVVGHLTAEGGEYRPELDRYFAVLGWGFGMFPNRAAYEDLRAAGLQVVRNVSLRQGIVRYYDFQVPAARIIEEMRVFPYRVDMLLPQLAEHFVWSGAGRGARATPRDYRSLREDTEFLNVLRMWRLEIDLQARLTEDAYRAAGSLLAEVQAELER